MGLFEGFDLDLNDYDGILDEIKEVKKERVEVPEGSYEVKVTKILSGITKSGIPKVSIYFKVLVGEFEGQMIFYNQNLNAAVKQTFAFQLKLVLKTLLSLDSGIEITSAKFLNDTDGLLAEVANAIKDKKEYIVEIKTNDKGYKETIVKQSFDSEIY